MLLKVNWNISLWKHHVAQERRLKDARARITVFLACCLAIYCTILGRLVYLGYTNYAPHMTLSRSSADETKRGTIYDCAGNILATDVLGYTLFADSRLVLEPKGTARQLKRVIPCLSAKDVFKNLKSGKRYIPICKNVSPQTKSTIEDLGLPGLFFKSVYTRVYPHGRSCAHVLGFCDENSRGISGIEKAFDKDLFVKKKAINLSLHIGLQEIARDVLAEGIQKFKANGGNVMIMDQQGEILCAASLPDFSGDGGDASEKIKGAFNRNFQGLFEPGSVLKIINAAIALQTKTANWGCMYDARHPVRLGRFTVDDFQPKRRILSFEEVFKFSSNIGNIQMSARFGPAVQQHFFKKFRLLKKPKLEISEVANTRPPKVWGDIQSKTISYGYGISIAPITFLRTVATILNEGHLVFPTLLKRTSDDLKALKVRREGRKPIVDKYVSESIHKLMRLVVTEGTARQCNIEGLYLCGKTGTAQSLSGGRYNKDGRITTFVWCLVAPDGRQFYGLTMLDNPKAIEGTYGFATGGWNVVPITKQIITALIPILNITPSKIPTENCQSA